ncbi:MAG: PQQ-binding-like beta-propeller repeat protein [Planctomycetes bacterium]|nr:PQQ-binding-like beta-propeller repeat protein [Planctomycetota bacterium]
MAPKTQIISSIPQIRFAVAIVSLALWAGAAQAQDAKTSAAKILKSPEARTGLVVHLGCGDGALTAELANGGKNVVLGLSADAAQVEKVRGNIQAKGIYGTVSVDCHPAAKIPLADNLANIVVADDYPALEKDGLKLEEVLRVLAPYGVAFLKGAKGKPEGMTVSQDGEWLKIVKPYPKEMDEWTQYFHDVSGMMMSKDQLVGPPESIRWITGGYWNGSMGDPVEIVSAGGRVFYANMTASKDQPSKGTPAAEAMLEARDAFNGLTLWTKKIMSADYRPAQPRVIAVGDKVYAPILESGECLGEIDAATGNLLKTYKFKSEDVKYVNGMFLADRGQQAWSAKTGEKLWELKIANPPKKDYRTMAQATHYHYFVSDENRIVYLSGSSLICYTLDKGERKWESPIQGKDEMLLYCGFGRVLTEEQETAPGKKYAPVPSVLRAYNAEDGKSLWKYELAHVVEKSRVRVFQAKADEIWCHTLRTVDGQPRPVPMFICLDAKTGQEKKAVPTSITNRRCHPHRATSRYLFGGDGAMFSLSDGKTLLGSQRESSPSALRGACQFGYIPANGLLYQDLNKCLCFNSLRGSAAFAPAQTPATADKENGKRLEKGPAFAEAIQKPAGDGRDWPTLRHDIRRSAISDAAISASPAPAWKAELPDKASSPVVAAGKVFVAVKDRHAVYALNAADGKTAWSYTTGGRVDSPPTYSEGRVLFGSSDGWVYCLTAADGKLIWRFRAAPSDRRIMVRGQVESSWPVHGAVLVENGVAYVSAGRHTAADGGIYLYALDAKTGNAAWENKALSEVNAINDIFLAEGEELYLDQLDIDKKTGKFLKKSQEEHVQTKALWGGALGMLNEEILEPPYSGQSGGRKHWRYIGYDGHLLAMEGDRIFGAVYESTAYGQDHTWRYGYRGWGKGEEGKLTLKGNKIFGVTKAGNWTQDFPGDAKFRVKAVICAGDKIFAAVAPDKNDSKKGEIWIYNAADGKPLGQIKLDAAPAFDGLAAVDGALIVSTDNKSVICLKGAAK